jgi:hypothetical protein
MNRTFTKVEAIVVTVLAFLVLVALPWVVHRPAC